MTVGLGLSTGRVARNTVLRTASTVITLAAGALSGVLVVRGLGPAGYGSFTFVWTIAWSAIMLVPLGFDRLIVRELNRRPPLLDLRRVLPAVSVAGLAVAAALVTLTVLTGTRSSLTVAMLVGAVYVATGGPFALVRAVFDAHERMGLTATVDVTESLAGLVGVVLALQLDGGLVEVSVALTVARLVALAVASGAHARLIPRSDDPVPPRPLRTLLRSSLPMAGSRVATELIRRVDILILGLLVAPREVGFYGAVATVVVYAPALQLELNRALYPVLSRAESPGDHDLLRLFGLTWRAHLLLGMIAAAGLAVLARPITVLLFGDDYAGAGPLLSLMAAVIPLRVLSELCAVTLDATYRQRRRLHATGLALGLNVAINLVLIPLYGIWGAAIATVATELGLLLGLTYGLRPHRPRLLVPLVVSLAAAAPVAAVAAGVRGHVLARLAAGAVAAAVALAVVVWYERRPQPGDGTDNEDET